MLVPRFPYLSFPFSHSSQSPLCYVVRTHCSHVSHAIRVTTSRLLSPSSPSNLPTKILEELGSLDVGWFYGGHASGDRLETPSSRADHASGGVLDGGRVSGDRLETPGSRVDHAGGGALDGGHGLVVHLCGGVCRGGMQGGMNVRLTLYLA